MGSPEAFAPAAISNFFTIRDDGLLASPPDLAHSGATGGGYMLSKGVRSTAELVEGSSGRGVAVVVNGDPDYEARTTKRAIEFLLRSAERADDFVRVDQTVEVPIGYGFGASAASALSGVIAVASLLGIEQSKAALAFHAHAADILCRTGLGTVSVIYEHGGAGIITKAGGPGIAEVRSVPVPRDVRIVTASLAPYEKSIILSSASMKERVNRLGEDALALASDLTIESLVRAGEVFSESLGLESPEVRHLEKVAREGGAIGASQNMVGHAVHALVREEDVAAVARALMQDRLSPRVDVYDFGSAAR
jgi:pantoate kinase